MRGSIRGSGLTDVSPLEREALTPAPVPETEPEGALTTAAQGLGEKPSSPARLAWRRFRRHKLALVGAIIFILLTLACVFAGVLTKYSPTQTFTMGTGKHFIGPTRGHWFGIDSIGRDNYTRVLYGGRISIAVGIGVALFATIFGTVVGVLAGYYGGWLDNVLMRVTDLFLAIPLIVILIVATQLPARQAWIRPLMGEAHSMRAIITILTLFFWMPIARVIRGLVLSLKEKEFVEAARAAGASDARIMARHLVPNCTGQIIINATLAVAAAILTEAALSFLGYGIDPVRAPTWGNLLTNAQGPMNIAPYLVWFPGMAIVITVLAVNFIGDGLRDALDPKQLSV
jgi:peptide/nickel transport system permease protein